MANTCSGAGPLGRAVRHPGPVVGWLANGVVVPVWFPEALERSRPSQYPNPIRTLEPIYAYREPIEWGPEDEVRFLS